MTKSDDCEGVGASAAVMLETIHAVLEGTTTTLVPEVAALRDVLRRFEAVMVGGVVSEPYVDAATRKATHVPLPVAGTAAAAKWPRAGHGWALLVSRALLATWQHRGLADLGGLHPEDRPAVLRELQGCMAGAAAWEHAMEPAIIEGTGLVWPWAGNVQEVYGKTDRADVYLRKTMATMKMARAMKAAPADSPLGTLAAFLRLETPPYEAWARSNPDQWCASFFPGNDGRTGGAPFTSAWCMCCRCGRGTRCSARRSWCTCRA